MFKRDVASLCQNLRNCSFTKFAHSKTDDNESDSAIETVEEVCDNDSESAFKTVEFVFTSKPVRCNYEHA